jgi:hypothetical protein
MSRQGWKVLNLPPGQSIKSYLGAHAATIDVGPPGHQALMESTFPLRVRSESGSLVPPDLSLVDQGSSLEPRSPLVPIAFPRRLDAGIDFKKTGLRLLPVIDDASGSAQIAGGQAFYANAVGKDADFIAAPVPGGVETFVQARSLDSPETFSLRVDLPTGASLRTSPNPGIAAEVVTSDGVVATISVPHAMDADSREVPVSYSVANDTLEMKLAHRSNDVHYPVLLDPVVEENQQTWHNNEYLDYNGWTPSPQDAYYNSAWLHWCCGYFGTGLYSYSTQNVYYPHGQSASWKFFLPGNESFIYAAEFDYVGLAPQSSCSDWGIARSGAWEQNNVYCASLSGYNQLFCLGGGCASNVGTLDNYAMFRTYANGAGYRNSIVHSFGGSRLWINDLTAPVEGLPVQTKLPTGWVDSVPAEVRLRGHDYGLGIKEFRLRVPGEPADRVRSHACSGDRNDRCPIASSTYTYSDNSRVGGDSFAYSTGVMPNGIDTVEGYVRDMAGNWSAPQSWQIKVDRAGPTRIDPGGTLWLYQNRTVPPGVHDLRVTAYDGDAAVHSSGVKKIEIYVCDTPDSCMLQWTTPDQTCDPDNCSLSTTWYFATPVYQIAPGRKTIRIRAYDQLGHFSDKQFDVIVPPLA